jgi:hypothetical protein
VRSPVALAHAESDKLHANDNIRRLADALPNVALIPCPSNKSMHDAEMAPEFEKFVAALP